MDDRLVYAVAAGVLGLLFGSFANVVVWRLPRRESLSRPGSHCPACNAPVRPSDNIPVVSWLVLRGRCRACKAPIALRYPAIELLVGILFAFVAYRLPDTPGHTRWDLAAFIPLVWVLVVLAFIDLEHKLLPNRIVVPAFALEAVLLLVATLAGPGFGAWARALAAAAASFAFFLSLALIAPRGMGMGDVKLSALLGLALGYLSWGRVAVGFMLSFVLGAVAGLILIAAGKAGRKTQVPFGPWLAAGTAIAVVAGRPIVDAWLGRI